MEAQWFSLFEAIMFYIVAADTELVNIEPYWNTGLGSCEPLITFSSIDECITLL